SSVTLTSGNNQTASLSTALSSPFVITVRDANGNLVVGAAVTWAIILAPNGATGQSLNPFSGVTQANGQATTLLTLGNMAGTYEVQATVSGAANSPITFTATAQSAATASSLVMTSGNDQTAHLSTALSSPFVVTVRDQNGNPMAGVNVNFSISFVP